MLEACDDHAIKEIIATHLAAAMEEQGQILGGTGRNGIRLTRLSTPSARSRAESRVWPEYGHVLSGLVHLA
jgi:hypothetical protein